MFSGYTEQTLWIEGNCRIVLRLVPRDIPQQGDVLQSDKDWRGVPSR